MKPPKSSSSQLAVSSRGGIRPQASGAAPASLEELRAQRRERLETNRRVEDLKLRLLRMTEQNIDQAVRLIRRWLND